MEELKVLYEIIDEDGHHDLCCFVCAATAAVEENGIVVKTRVVQEVGNSFGEAVCCDRCAAYIGTFEL